MTIPPMLSKHPPVSDYDGCSICLSDFTSTGNHRPCTLKCGHIFGIECVNSWFGKNKTMHCPICAVICRKRDIRTLFATKIIAYDGEKEKQLLNELQKEKRTILDLEKENKFLKSTIEILNNQITKIKTETPIKIHRTLTQQIKSQSLSIHYDKISNYIITITKNNNQTNIRKFQLSNLLHNYPSIRINTELTANSIRYYAIENISEILIKFNNTNLTIMSSSNRNDGNILISNTNILYILNIHSNNIIKKYYLKYNITAIYSTDKLFIGDEKGNLNIIDDEIIINNIITEDLQVEAPQENNEEIENDVEIINIINEDTENEKESCDKSSEYIENNFFTSKLYNEFKLENNIFIKNISNKPITNIYYKNNKFFIITFDGIYTNNIDSFYLYFTMENMLCIGSYNNENTIISTFRDKENNLKYFIKDTEDKIIYLGLQSFRKVKSKIDKSYFYIVDDRYLYIYNHKRIKVHEYNVKNIIDFLVEESFIIILTEKFINIYY